MTGVTELWTGGPEPIYPVAVCYTVDQTISWHWKIDAEEIIAAGSTTF
jgi:hypothetical protein